MDHETAHPLLDSYHDGVLTPPQAEALRRHLEGCAACRAASDQWRRAAAALFPRPRVEPSEVFIARVMDRVEALPSPRAAFRWGWAGWASGAVLAAASVLWLVPSRSSAPLPMAAVSESSHHVYLADWMEGPVAQADLDEGYGTDVETILL